MSAPVVNVYTTSATTENMSRQEMLCWVNDCLQSEFSKIEQLHTGAGYCMFTEVIFPGSIQLKRVKWNSRNELDWLSNWKLVQTAWKQLGVDKIVPVEKLIKGKFQDNFEFLQWFKKFFDANYDGHEYNPLEARNFEELPKENKIKSAGGGGAGLRAPQPKAPARSAAALLPQRTGSNASVNNTGAPAATARKPATPATVNTGAPPPYKAASSKVSSSTTAASKVSNGVDPQVHESVKRELEEARQQLAESDDVVSGLEKERDFYFTKLRKIEVICQEHEVDGVVDVQKVLEVLYETEEGFVPPEEVEGTN